ncbi:MAG: DUF3500 domain-containing protein [Planctomycetes bacterium]|nr:DUF3500 domain-containing protein [Planctomycetota bacterium]
MNPLNRRAMLRTSGATSALLALSPFTGLSSFARGAEAASDSLPMQLYKSLSDEQRTNICLAVDHRRRHFISNWWYVNPEHRIHTTFNGDQQELIGTIFESLHSPEHRDAVNKQVKSDLMGKIGNTPSIGFFGTPQDDDFEFIYTGHHVTRRCNAHSDKGHGFGGAPIFYGNFAGNFHETKDHPGNPYWYQGLIFNEFVQALDGRQQKDALISANPRSEKPKLVILKKKREWTGLSCATLSQDQKNLLLETMRKMMATFRDGDIAATIESIKSRNIIDELYVSYYDGKYDIGSDKVWDTWQIEGPNMVWYFRGEPHIHAYFHLNA